MAGKIRVRFSITEAGDGCFLVILERIPGQVSEPPKLYTGREVIAEWRAAERRLETLDPDSDDALAVQREIDHLRDLYQQATRTR